MTGRTAGRTTRALLVVAGLLVPVGCAAGPPEPAAAVSAAAASCSSAPMGELLRDQVRLDPGTVIVRGVLAPTGTIETVPRTNRGAWGGWPIVEHRLTTSDVLVGTIEPTATVWTVAAAPGGWQVSADLGVYTDSRGGGIFVISPGSVPGRLTVVDGFPVIDGSVVLGYACSNGQGFARAVAVPAGQLPGDLRNVAGGNLAPVTPTFTDSLVRVPLADFEAAVTDG